MDWIVKNVNYLYAVLAVAPVIPFALVYYIYGAFVKDRKKAFRMAMDVTTGLLIGCVAVLFDKIFNSGFGLYGIMLVMLLGGGLLGNLQFRKRGAVNVKHIVKVVWRLGFFAMSLLYVVLMCIGLGQTLIATVY
ncbi:hypothetical protein IJ21_19390 [Paenibacillus sp. 32O-W]|uniref:DUF3397 domain-containing protein n=1 Tax=Paenibacillus sp. 32O-W TaxID=1695218 RepID=UPI00071F1C39|nr:DUF3397 domain-containing protein [Paenibacillus sp. 32O-W]ALS27340.1 hypothetical protein IJ21_19390 [Paenibacillus sp. 32O-W]